MNRHSLADAVSEAERFIRAAGRLASAQALRDDQRQAWRTKMLAEGHLDPPEPITPYDHFDPSPESAAVRRASMELTRSLARMRKYG